MGKRIVQIDVEECVCDFCNIEECYDNNHCLKCKKYICRQCRKDNAIEYPSRIMFVGQGDALYCKKCNDFLLKNPNKLFSAYFAVSKLRDEYHSWINNFNIIMKSLEEQLAKEIECATLRR